MNELSLRFWEIFFEVYENLPRQGPGNRTCAARALGLCRALPEKKVKKISKSEKEALAQEA